MGLLEALLGKDNPAAMWANDNSNFLGALSAGLAGGQNFQDGIAKGLAGAPQAKALDYQAGLQRKADQKVEAQTNATKVWLQKNHPDLAQMVDAGMPISEAWQEAMTRMQPKEPKFQTVGDKLVRIDGDNVSTAYDPYASTGGVNPKEAFSNEKDLYGQYASADPVKTYEVVKSAYERVRQSAQLDTGAGDMGLIYGFMKLNDPGSVVRESEFAMAAQAGSFGEQIQGLVNRVLSGQRLTPEVRRQFLEASDKLYAESAANLSDINSQFSTRATGAGVDPSRIIRPPEAYQPIQMGVPAPSTKYPGVTITKVQ